MFGQLARDVSIRTSQQLHTAWFNMINTYGYCLSTPAHWPSATGKKRKRDGL